MNFLRSMAPCLLILLGGVAPADAAIFSVTNTSNEGPGSLRQAILDSNATAGPNVIEIDLPSGGTPNVITPTGQFLPPLKGPVTIRVKSVMSASPSPAPTRGGALPVVPAPPTTVVILDGSKLVKPRTPDDCPGASVVYNGQTNQWESSRVSGTGPNVRGYYGAGLSVHDSHDVEIAGFEIRNFCIGVAAVRSHNVFIHDMKISESHGAAGVLFTGDDGNGMATPLSYNNVLLDSVLLDNGDGFEFTRGTRDSLLQGTTIALTHPLPADGNAIEFADPGDNNAVIGNTITKYVETAVTVGGANQTIRDNSFIANQGPGLRAAGANLLILGNAFSDNRGDAMSVSGAGSRVIDNVVSGNAARGIVVGSLGVTLSRNSIHHNMGLGIDAAVAGRGGAPAQGTAPAPGGRVGGRAGAAGSPAGRNGAAPVTPVVLPPAPVIAPASKWSAEAIVISGSLMSKPNERYAIQLFASHATDRQVGGDGAEGEMYIGTASATTDASGKGTFSLMLRIPDILGDGQATGFFTATATDAAGTTSKFSNPLQISKR